MASIKTTPINELQTNQERRGSTPHDLAIALMRERTEQGKDLSNFEVALSFVRHELSAWYQDDTSDLHVQEAIRKIAMLGDALYKLIKGCEFDESLAEDMDSSVAEADPRYMNDKFREWYDRRNVPNLTDEEKEVLGDIALIVTQAADIVRDSATRQISGVKMTYFQGAMGDFVARGATRVVEREMTTPEGILTALGESLELLGVNYPLLEGGGLSS